MKILKSFIFVLFILPLFLSCNAQSAENKDQHAAIKPEEINVYYFHFTRRCATCNAVEDKTKEILNELYPAQIENKNIVFMSINLEDENSKEIAKILGVSGQALIFSKGDQKVDLTTVGFMNARSNPDKLKEKIKETVDGLLI
ncbi:MAG: nitrophenyl compound nitroreductase subunit ArsF family protein [Bacteroidales bacterium]|jgi:thioredoxin-related protein|nr:nitrophenyl compound nitroreductase subunit ArsF family protein [Bacteroidales bacterium]